MTDQQQEERAIQVIGQAIREWRVSQHLTQSQMAMRCGVSRGAIGYWEAGKGSPPLHVAVLMEVRAGIPMTPILWRAEDRYSHWNPINEKGIIPPVK